MSGPLRDIAEAVDRVAQVQRAGRDAKQERLQAELDRAEQERRERAGGSNVGADTAQ